MNTNLNTAIQISEQLDRSIDAILYPWPYVDSDQLTEVTNKLDQLIDSIKSSKIDTGIKLKLKILVEDIKLRIVHDDFSLNEQSIKLLNTINDYVARNNQ